MIIHKKHICCTSQGAVRNSQGAVRNYQGGRVANNRGRVMIFCALKKGGLQFFQLSLRGGS